MIGQRIADARKKINLSQAQLAEQLFISSQAVGKWERGESMPDIVTLSRLAEIMSVDLNYFADGTMPSAAQRQPGELPEEQTPETSAEKPQKLQWDMSGGNWVDADFSGLSNLHDKFSGSNMQRCKFIGSELSGLLLKGNNVQACDFSGSDIGNSQIQRSHLEGNAFRDCSLRDMVFSGSFVSGCDMTGADLTGIVFKDGGFEKNVVANAVWNRSSFKGSNILDVVFEGTIENCAFEGCSFRKVTFQNATLINTFFKNNSLKRIRFVDCKADRMTYEFLKNGKADLSGITLLND